MHLAWEGCSNARDLVGLAAPDGASLRRGALVRCDGPDRLAEAGWEAVERYGVRTVIDLRDPSELVAGFTPPPWMSWVALPLEDDSDTGFWAEWRDSGLWATPLYYSAFLARWPERCADVVRAVLDAPPGGVVVACGRGRDRTGLAVLVLLAALGVAPEAIAADYALSLGPGHGADDETAFTIELLRQHDTTAEQAILDTLAAVDVVALLGAAGVTDQELAALRTRLLLPDRRATERARMLVHGDWIARFDVDLGELVDGHHLVARGVERWFGVDELQFEFVPGMRIEENDEKGPFFWYWMLDASDDVGTTYDDNNSGAFDNQSGGTATHGSRQLGATVPDTATTLTIRFSPPTGWDPPEPWCRQLTIDLRTGEITDS